jgi:hypothetical protein
MAHNASSAPWSSPPSLLRSTSLTALSHAASGGWCSQAAQQSVADRLGIPNINLTRAAQLHGDLFTSAHAPNYEKALHTLSAEDGVRPSSPAQFTTGHRRIAASVVHRLTRRCGGSLGAWQLRMEAARYLCWMDTFQHGRSRGGFGDLLKMAANLVLPVSSVLLYVTLSRSCRMRRREEGRSRVTAFQHPCSACQRLLVWG